MCGSRMRKMNLYGRGTTTSGIYTPKFGYQALSILVGEEHLVWLWKLIWKFKCPLNILIFMWLTLRHKVHTWDNL
jgi:hypothetical protein